MKNLEKALGSGKSNKKHFRTEESQRKMQNYSHDLQNLL